MPPRRRAQECALPPHRYRARQMKRVGQIELRAVGRVASPLTDADVAPKQGDEGAPGATLVLEPQFLEALHGIVPGDAILVFTWLDRADRSVLSVHPRGDLSRDPQGVFATRSPDRPNPIGLHRVRVESIDGLRIRVADLEALDGTPIVDLKPVLSADPNER
jgi:tRNA-Thr(GGU) m(6)t(6)A37 methyltransferase TsaA